MTEAQASWLMPVQSAVPRTRRMVTAAPAFFRSKRAGDTSGYALPTDPMLNCDGLAQAETRQASQERLIAWHREELATELAQRRKAHKATCSVMADLQGAVNAILAMGGR